MFVAELTVQIVTKGAQSAILRVDQGTVGTRTMELPVQPLPLVNERRVGDMEGHDLRLGRNLLTGAKAFSTD